MRVHFWDENLFVREADSVPIIRGQTMKIPLTTQCPTSEKERVEALADATVSSTSWLIIAVIILEFSLLSKVLQQVRSLSIIVHLLLIDVRIPATVTIFYQKIFEVVSYDLFEEYLYFGDFLEWAFDLKDRAVSDRAEELGYESHYIVTNLGSLLVFFVLNLILVVIFYSIVKADILDKKNRLRVIAKKQIQRFKWNGLLQFLNESYLLLCFSVAFNAKEAMRSVSLQFSTWSLGVNSSIALIACLSVLLAPIWLIVNLNLYWYPEYILSIEYLTSQ